MIPAEKLPHRKTSQQSLRVGLIRYTNALPIVHFFQQQETVHVHVPGAPSELNRMLAECEVDVSLVSAFSYAERADEYVALRGLSISTRGKVGSILLFSRKALHELDGCRVALTRISASSVALLKILLGELGVYPEFITREPHLPSMLEEADAALLIADDALYWDTMDHGCDVYDLGELWNRQTGLPMTFAVCAVPRSIVKQHPQEVRDIHRRLLASKRKAKAEMGEIIRAAMRMCGNSEPYWQNYFNNLVHDFDDELRKGAEGYFRMAYLHGLLPQPIKLDMWGEED